VKAGNCALACIFAVYWCIYAC